MLPFLHQVARYYLNASSLEDYCFVFPNRRSGQFFSHYMQRELVTAQPGPHLLPRVMSINDLVDELTGTVAATDIEMTFALYDAYCKAMGDRAQTFDKFIYWSQLIIGDFNDIDKSLANARDIYQNLSDLHGINANYLTEEVRKKVESIFGEGLFTAFFDTSADADLWQPKRTGTEAQKAPKGQDGQKQPDDRVKREFESLWNALADIYEQYHQALAAKGVLSPGRQLRQVAEQPPVQLSYSRLVFVGFGVLSAAEMRLFEHLKREGKADFWWDNAGIKTMLGCSPNDPGALLIYNYCKHFGAKDIEPVDNAGQNLRVVAVPSNVGQAKVAVDEVALMPKDESPTSIDTAIVLPDENLLVPLLHSIPAIDRLNVTLGYPLRSSGIVSLMHIVARLHHRASKERDDNSGREEWNYYREDVNDILSHPLIKTYFTREALAMAANLSRTNRFRIPAREFESLSFASLFEPDKDCTQPGNDREQAAGYLDNLLTFCNLLMERMNQSVANPEANGDDNSDEIVPLQQAFLLMYTDVLVQLKRALAECEQMLLLSTVFFLIDRLAAASMVAFTGEPLQGLQVMGLLETRSLDFKNVVVLSMNERILPRRHGLNSFIPNYIRRAHGMSTSEQQEAIVAYNFYRLLNRAENVTMIYDSSASKSSGSSEPSRFITQLEIIYGRQLHRVEMTLDVQKSSPISIEAPGGERLALRDLYTRDPDKEGGKYLSASALKHYVSCPLKFYMHYVQGLNEDSELGDFMDSGTFGTIVHDTLDACYWADKKSHTFTKDKILYFKQHRLRKVVERFIKIHYMHIPEDEVDTDKRSIKGDAYMLIDTIMSFVGFVLDHDIKLIEDQGSFTVIECEEMHYVKQMQIGGATFNFMYKPDRVDRLADGTLRIVDYKTGGDSTEITGVDDLFIETPSKATALAVMQLFLYCYAYMFENSKEKQVQPVIYKVSQMESSGVIVKDEGQYDFKMDDEKAQDFIKRMGEIVNAIFDKSYIQADEGSRACNFCRFIDYCRRTPAVRNKW